MIDIDEGKAKRKIDREERARKQIIEREPGVSPLVARTMVAIFGLFVLAIGVGVLPKVSNVDPALRNVVVVFTGICGLITIGSALLLSDSSVTRIARQLFDRF